MDPDLNPLEDIRLKFTTSLALLEEGVVNIKSGRFEGAESCFSQANDALRAGIGKLSEICNLQDPFCVD